MDVNGKMTLTVYKVKGKVRSTLGQAMKAQRVLDRDEWSTPFPGHFTPGKTTQYPLYQRLGGPRAHMSTTMLSLTAESWVVRQWDSHIMFHGNSNLIQNENDWHTHTQDALMSQLFP
jgi:hypothetical protein